MGETFKRIGKEEYESENFRISKIDKREYDLSKKNGCLHLVFTTLKEAKEYANKHANNEMWVKCR